MEKAKLHFAGGAGSVTGANFLFESDEVSFLVDCGLEQGSQVADVSNWEPFPYEPKDVDVLFITHAHLDHIGRIPKLVHDGFRGRIISTAATKDLANIMLRDTINILGNSESGEAYDLNKIYTPHTLAQAMSQWDSVEYHESKKLSESITYEFKDAGHVLGSAMITFSVTGPTRINRVVFTGDLGNSPSPILRDTEPLTETDYLIMESVYGDRNHEGRAERKDFLLRIIKESIAKRGVLIVPVFSLERTQEFLYEINDFVENDLIPDVPIFLDSPLAIEVTEVFYKYKNLLNTQARDIIKSGDDIFMFPGLKKTSHSRESKKIAQEEPPKIIIAGSGMSTGGRVLHHELRYLSDPSTTVLLTGYQTAGTLGRHLQEGSKTVRIFDEEVAVRAKIEYVRGYSGHKDSDHLVEFVGGAANSIKKVFIAMGDFSSAMFLAQRLHDSYDGIKTHVPHPKEQVILRFE